MISEKQTFGVVTSDRRGIQHGGVVVSFAKDEFGETLSMTVGDLQILINFAAVQKMIYELRKAYRAQ
jgi:hypothetical protein